MVKNQEMALSTLLRMLYSALICGNTFCAFTLYEEGLGNETITPSRYLHN